MEEVLPSRTVKFDAGQICNGAFSNPWCYQLYVYIYMYIYSPPKKKISGILSLYLGGRKQACESSNSCLN